MHIWVVDFHVLCRMYDQNIIGKVDGSEVDRISGHLRSF